MRTERLHAHGATRARCGTRAPSFGARTLLGLLALLACTARNPAFVQPDASAAPQADDESERSPLIPRDAAADQKIAPPDLQGPDAAPDARPPEVDAAAPPVDLAPDLAADKPPPGAALLVVSDTSLSKSDAQLRTVLEELKFTVTAKTGSASSAGDATGKALVVISGSAVSADVSSKFRDVSVPVVVFDASVFAPMKMTGGKEDTDFGTVVGVKNVDIVDDTHPLAAGLHGTITVANADIQESWGAPSVDAIKVATVAGQSNHWAIFAYEAGRTMVTLEAPARRVGAFVRFPE